MNAAWLNAARAWRIDLENAMDQLGNNLILPIAGVLRRHPFLGVVSLVMSDLSRPH